MIPMCMAAVMAGTITVPAWASPEFSRDAQEWEKLRDNTMEYGELEALVHEYNVTVLNNKVDLADSRGKTSEEIASSYRDAASDLYNSVVYPEDDSELSYAMSYATATSIDNQAKSLERMADDNVDDGEIRKLQYDQVEATIASGAQNSMNSYQQLLESRKTLEANRALLTALYESTVAQAGLGMATQADVLSAQQNVQSLEASIISMDANINKVRQSLCVMTGWAYNANPEIVALPAADISRLDSMNPTTDLEKAKENNYTLKIDKKKLSNSSSSTSRQTLEKTVQDDEQKIGAALNNQYHAVLQAKTAYDQAIADFDLEAKNMQTAQLKFDLKMLSKLEYIQTQTAFTEKQANKAIAEMALLQAMDAYDWALRGLLSLS